MTTSRMNLHLAAPRAAVSLVALALWACATRGPAPASHPASGGEQHFSTPKAAVDALLAACRANDDAKIVAIFGEQAKGIIATGDAATDRERCQKLDEAAQQSMRLDPKGGALHLVVGTDDWTMPIPLVKDGKGWYFDTAEGMQEIRRRRIGADELEAITACRFYVHAQEDYARRTRGVYAQKLASSPGKKDGLYWPSKGTRDMSPLGPVAAVVEGTKGEHPHGTWRGYHFRILTRQGSAARGGAKTYVAGGRMTGGFALVAYPIVYGTSGIMTFVVGPDGQVYEKDLGEKTAELAGAITEYDPDGTWKRVGG
ncbi:MAG TPA: DUF2950 domain-containing protein [Candidatus Eisenbacteria bacterium]|nr:DUF2950 domain-containing protein [Candidatus Eisenbacteria bacterium]